MTTRDFISRAQGPTIVETPAGMLAIHPLESDRVRVVSGWGDNDGTTGLALNGVTYGATGFCWLQEGSWTDVPPDGHTGDLMVSRRGSFGKDATASAIKKAREVVCEAVSTWAPGHADELTEADRIWRSNQARGAEEQLARAEAYAGELREIIAANDRGESRSEYSHSFEVLYLKRS